MDYNNQPPVQQPQYQQPQYQQPQYQQPQYQQPQYQQPQYQQPQYQQPQYQQPQYQQPQYQPQYQQPVQPVQPVYAQPQYQQPVYRSAAPVGQLKTNRSLAKFIFLGLITFGIYNLVIYCGISQDINITASRYDGKKTMHFALMAFLISWLTLGIGPIVWMHNICARMGAEKARRGLGNDFGAADFWLWNVLGSLIIVGPFIFTYKFLQTDNMINADYNLHG